MKVESYTDGKCRTGREIARNEGGHNIDMRLGMKSIPLLKEEIQMVGLTYAFLPLLDNLQCIPPALRMSPLLETVGNE
jgi:hypothetical protein